MERLDGKRIIITGGTSGMGDMDTDFIPVMAFMASDSSKFITGQTISVDGGVMRFRYPFVDTRSFDPSRARTGRGPAANRSKPGPAYVELIVGVTSPACVSPSRRIVCSLCPL